MTWQEALQLTNLFLLPGIFYLVKLEGRLIKLEMRLSSVIAVLARRAGIDLRERRTGDNELDEILGNG